MKIDVLGGGPAGLYLSILAKRADPDLEITVHEKNARDDTFGWGVVFSDETLGNLELADPETYAAITRDFAYWQRIELRIQGRSLQSGGHGFCGIARRRLLAILQERAESLGVSLRFGVDVAPESLRGQSDLLVAADGAGSRVRELWRERFVPRIDHGAAWYIWLGTPQSFDAFTFSFRENEHGLFQAHAYQFEPATSTFIVECDEASWRAAGLDHADEATSIRYCEEVFADDLGGHPLHANRSQWIRFRTVRCDRWQDGDVVLLGDAAHTAHFSVGSGTKLAMEDAIALADALKAHGDDVAGALVAYETARQDQVARTQKAAGQSQQWFEETRRHVAHDPERLFFSLLSRTRRVTHENLAVRESAYVEAVDHWFRRHEGVDPAAPVPPMFVPFRLRGLELANRVVVSPMCQYSAVDGVPTDWHLVHLGSRAQGGAGLVIAEMTDVSAEGRITEGCAGLWNDAQETAWARIVDFVHGQTAAKIGIQLGHAGRKGATVAPWDGGGPCTPSWPLVAPSPLAWAEGHRVPKEMDAEDMKRALADHVAAAKRAARCGFDFLEVHCAHGYLLSSFLSPITNVRTDGFGGNLANRARFPLEVVDAVRQIWDGPLSVRVSATDWMEGGFDLAQAVDFAGMLKEAGVDIVDVSAGQVHPAQAPVYGRAFQTPFSERIRNEVGIPTMTVGAIWDFDRINTILVAGRADLVALARPHLADPYFTRHAAVTQGYDGLEWPSQYERAESIATRMFGPSDES